MVVICEECGLKYKIDPSKIIGTKARFNCKGCSKSIIVEKPQPEENEDQAALEDALLSEAPTSVGTSEPPSQQATDTVVASEAPAATGASVPPPQEGDKKTKRKGGLGLTYKVTFLMLLVSLLPGAVYFALSFKQTSEQIISETNKTGVMVSKLLSSEVDEWIDKNVRALNALSNLPAMQSMSQFEQETILKALQREYPWMYLVFTTDENGLNIARSDGKSLKDYSSRQYVKDVVGGSELAWQNLIGKTSKKPALVLAVPIKKGDMIVGVLAAAMNRETISNLVTTYRQGQTGSSFLVDTTGKAVAHRNNAYVLRQQDMSDHPLVMATKNEVHGRVEFDDANGVETIGFAENTKLGWTLAIQQEKEESFEPLKKAQLFAYTLLAVTVVAIVIIAFFASRAIVTPIRKLTDAANRISVGDLDVELAYNSKDEIGDLADAIMRMQDSIRLSISRLTRRRR